MSLSDFWDCLRKREGSFKHVKEVSSFKIVKEVACTTHLWSCKKFQFIYEQLQHIHNYVVL